MIKHKNMLFPGFIFSSFFMLCLFSCQTVVDLELPEKPPSLVVNCFFNPDSVFAANISKSQYVLDNAAIKKIDNAKISVYEESVLVDNLVLTSSGNYISGNNYRPLVNKNYKITVTAPGYGNTEATDIIPEASQILDVDTGNFFFENQRYFELKIRFRDNPSIKNNYQLQLYSKNYFMNFDSLGNMFEDTSSFFFPIGFESRDLVFEDEMWFGNSGALFNDELFGNKGEYQISIYLMAYGSMYDSAMISSNGYLYNELKISLKSVSQAYYNYVGSYQKYQHSNGNPFAEPVQVYNNIRGGYGIFAGYNSAAYFLKL